MEPKLISGNICHIFGIDDLLIGLGVAGATAAAKAGVSAAVSGDGTGAPPPPPMPTGLQGSNEASQKVADTVSSGPTHPQQDMPDSPQPGLSPLPGGTGLGASVPPPVPEIPKIGVRPEDNY